MKIFNKLTKLMKKNPRNFWKKKSFLILKICKNGVLI